MGDVLPEFVSPMLAQIGEPFDSEDYFFEVKWDGTRAIALVEGGGEPGYRLHNRRKFDMLPRYPELGFLGQLPAGVVLDGEIVVLRDGKPSFRDVMTRDHARNPARIRHLIETHPVHYMVFDLLYQNFEAVVGAPLSERRERLQELVAACGHERLVLSRGVTGEGVRFFEEACQRELEGVIAKRLASRYRPGQRSDSWLKIKRKDG